MVNKIDFLQQFADGKKAAGNIRIKGEFDRVIFCGLGGSAIPAEIISMLWLDNFNGYINRGYGLPHWVNEKYLVVCTSWSGNTDETISSFNAAVSGSISVIAITKGGKLAEIAKNKDMPCIIILDDSVAARFGIGYMFSALLTVLNNSAIIDNNQPAQIEEIAEGVGRNISSKIIGKIPLIYSSYQWRYLARFWKIHFNENCKIHSFSNFFPEAAHNEISGFGSNGDLSYFPIILIDLEEDARDVEKLKKFAAFLKKQNISHEIVELSGENRFQKIFKNYNLAVSTSVELALSRGIEPFDTSVIEQFKKS